MRGGFMWKWLEINSMDLLRPPNSEKCGKHCASWVQSKGGWVSAYFWIRWALACFHWDIERAVALWKEYQNDHQRLQRDFFWWASRPIIRLSIPTGCTWRWVPPECSSASGEGNEGMTWLATQTSLGRESLYKSLSDQDNPKFNTVQAVLNALGLKFAIVSWNSPRLITSPIQVQYLWGSFR